MKENMTIRLVETLGPKFSQELLRLWTPVVEVSLLKELHEAWPFSRADEVCLP